MSENLDYYALLAPIASSWATESEVSGQRSDVSGIARCERAGCLPFDADA
jgi:hypothetical protein